MKLSIKAFAITSGILWGATVCVATLWLLMIGARGEIISKLGQFYLGYSFSVVGAFVGLAWGFVDGAVSGAIFAWLYNKVAKA